MTCSRCDGTHARPLQQLLRCHRPGPNNLVLWGLLAPLYGKTVVQKAERNGEGLL